MNSKDTTIFFKNVIAVVPCSLLKKPNGNMAKQTIMFLFKIPVIAQLHYIMRRIKERNETPFW